MQVRSPASQNPSLPLLSMFASYTLIASLPLLLLLYQLRVSFHESLLHRALIFCPFFLGNFIQRHTKRISPFSELI